MTNIKNICVFASSSNDLDEIYYKDARKLGLLIGQSGMNIVYGGSRRGLMYACAGAVKEAGGELIGIMPQKLANMGFANPDDCKDFHITEGMRERKALLDKLSDAVIAIPGGYGTLEELSEMIVQKQLGYNNKPIVVLNTAGFYEPIVVLNTAGFYDKLIEFMDSTILLNFANNNAKNLYYIAPSPEEAISYIQNYIPVEIGSKFAVK